jgi:ribosomal protein S18 acetylase RimI-like enzyme
MSIIGYQLYENYPIFIKHINENKNIGQSIIFTIPNKRRSLEPSHCVLYIPYHFDTAYISDVFVEKTLRRQGIASCLIKESIKYSKNYGINRIELDNMTGNSNILPYDLYEKLGFKYINYPFPEMYIDL